MTTETLRQMLDDERLVPARDPYADLTPLERDLFALVGDGMTNKDLIYVIEQIGREKGIGKEVLFEAVESALLSASKNGFSSDELPFGRTIACSCPTTTTRRSTSWARWCARRRSPSRPVR